MLHYGLMFTGQTYRTPSFIMNLSFLCAAWYIVWCVACLIEKETVGLCFTAVLITALITVPCMTLYRKYAFELILVSVVCALFWDLNLPSLSCQS